MKTISENKYSYEGTMGKYHLFKCIVPGFSSEILCVEEARYVKTDGTSRFFNTIKAYNEKMNVEIFQQ